MKKFIDDNDKFLTAIGIFGALSGVFSAINMEILSFLSLALLIIITIEVMKTIPSYHSIDKTFLAFLVLFGTFLFVLVIVVLFSFKTYNPIFLMIVIEAIYLFLADRIFDRIVQKGIRNTIFKKLFIFSIEYKLFRKIFTTILAPIILNRKMVLAFFTTMTIMFGLFILIITFISANFVHELISSIDYYPINGTLNMTINGIRY